MFDNFKNLGNLMGQAREMRDKLEQLQAELAHKTVEGESGAGAVRVTMNGKFEVLRVQLDRPLIQTLAGQGDDADVQMIEDLIAGACNAALQKAQEMAKQTLSTATGGLSIPGLDNLLGGGNP